MGILINGEFVDDAVIRDRRKNDGKKCPAVRWDKPAYGRG